MAQKAPGNFDGKEDYRGRVFMPVCKKVLDVLDRHKIVYSGVVALTPGTDNFGDREAVIAFCRHYGIIEDNAAPLLAELYLLEDMFRRGGEDLPSDLLGLFKFLLPHNRIFYRVHKAVKIGATLPVTSASSERSFSALRRIKTYLRTTMSDQRTSDLGVLAINREELSKLAVADVIKRFATKNQRIPLE